MCIIFHTEPVPVKPVANPHAIARPHATPQMLQKQGSFRGLGQLQQSSPFKRQLSLRLNDLPSNLERTRSMSLDNAAAVNTNNNIQPPGTELLLFFKLVYNMFIYQELYC